MHRVNRIVQQVVSSSGRSCDRRDCTNSCSCCNQVDIIKTNSGNNNNNIQNTNHNSIYNTLQHHSVDENNQKNIAKEEAVGDGVAGPIFCFLANLKYRLNATFPKNDGKF